MKAALEKSEKYRAWHAGEIESLAGDVRDVWPRDAEYELIEKQVRGIAARLGVDTFGLETIESFIERYAGDVRKAYREGRIPPEPGDSNSPYRRLCAAEAEATNLWLRHVLDFLIILDSAPQPTPAKQAARRRVILFASASPNELDKLDLDVEVREIRDELQRSSDRHQFQLEVRPACRPTDFVRELLLVRPEFVHFSGHGSKEGALFFEDDDRGHKPTSAQAVGNLFAACSDFVHCVILNACFAEMQADAICKHIPFVIGMRGEIEDRSAILFSRAFYLALGSGGDVPHAYNIAVTTLELESLPGAEIPVLLQEAGRVRSERRRASGRVRPPSPTAPRT